MYNVHVHNYSYITIVHVMYVHVIINLEMNDVVYYPKGV